VCSSRVCEEKKKRKMNKISLYVRKKFPKDELLLERSRDSVNGVGTELYHHRLHKRPVLTQCPVRLYKRRQPTRKSWTVSFDYF